MNRAGERKLLRTVEEGLRRVGLSLPYLVGLIAKIHVEIDRRVPTMGIFASGRLVVNPDFVEGLSTQDLVFVLTHELYHLILRTHDRGEGADALAFNQAHDYIINDMLREELTHPQIPAGGLDWPGARFLSAEKIMWEMEHDPWRKPQPNWNVMMTGNGGEPGEEGPPGDVLGSSLERQWFPDLKPADQQASTADVTDAVNQAQALRMLMDPMHGRGTRAGGQQNEVEALRGKYRPPWELALQRWLESAAPSERSYARPSRRGADRSDVVLAGRKRESWTLHVVLDTSGSMAHEIPQALGVIADFCEAVGVDRIHLVQCDTEVGSDEVLTPAEVARWQITGYGGSNLTPGMERLGEDPEVAAAVVLTDGDVEYPEQPVPYSVLWVLPPWRSAEEFRPRYGKVIAMTHS